MTPAEIVRAFAEAWRFAGRREVQASMGDPKAEAGERIAFERAERLEKAMVKVIVTVRQHQHVGAACHQCDALAALEAAAGEEK